MTVDTPQPPPDDWSDRLWRELGPRFAQEIPAEPVHELDMNRLSWVAWLVATGRLEGDTPPWPAWRPYHDLGAW